MPAGYYSGDKPNPNLKAFVEAHLQAHPYDAETDDYAVPAFDHPINTTKATAIYNMHTYWSKKPHDAIREYIRHYTQPGDLVLDPFCGSGGTALAALMEGRKAIAIDRSPAATFITKNYCTPVDVNDLREAFEELKRKVKPEIDWLYETKCEKCDSKASIGYTVYSQVFECARCLSKVPLFDCLKTEGKTAAGKPRKVMACPYCYARSITEEISTSSKKFGSIPVLASYTRQCKCKPKRDQRRYNDKNPKKREFFEKYDLIKIKEIEEKEIPYWYPSNEFPKSFHLYERCALHLQNINYISDFYTKRSLWALAAIREALNEIAKPDSATAAAAIWTAVTTVALSGTKMLREEKRAIQGGTYYIPSVSREIKITNGIDYNILQLLKAEEELQSLLGRICKLLKIL